jgi:hypothetical protein
MNPKLIGDLAHGEMSGAIGGEHSMRSVSVFVEEIVECWRAAAALRFWNFAICAMSLEHSGLNVFDETLIPKIDFLPQVRPGRGCAETCIDKVAERSDGNAGGRCK